MMASAPEVVGPEDEVLGVGGGAEGSRGGAVEGVQEPELRQPPGPQDPGPSRRGARTGESTDRFPNGGPWH